MNFSTLLQKSSIKRAVQAGSALTAMAAGGLSYAATLTGGGTPAAAITSLSTIRTNIGATAGDILSIILTIVTIAGVLLVIMGIVHLKQNYTGTGQEKHLSKGLACLGFGTALFIAVPITHALVKGIGGSSGQYDSWQAISTAQSIGT